MSSCPNVVIFLDIPPPLYRTGGRTLIRTAAACAMVCSGQLPPVPPLPSIERVRCPLRFLPSLDLAHDGGNGIGIRGLHGGAVPAEALAPYLHVAGIHTLYRAIFSADAEVGIAQIAPRSKRDISAHFSGSRVSRYSRTSPSRSSVSRASACSATAISASWPSR